MIDVKYGTLKEIYVNDRFGVRAAIANVTISSPDQPNQEDAALILCRRSFGVGRSHLILRQNMHAVLDTEELLQTAYDATLKLFGSVDKDDMHKIADLILNCTDDLVMHPPEDQMIEWKRNQKIIEQSQALIKVNDEVILDAR